MTLVEKLKDWVSSKKSESYEVAEPVDDWETRDKSLRALRRLRRKQIDEIERQQLNRAISVHNQNRTKAYLTDNSILGSGGRLKVKSKPKKLSLFMDECGFMRKGRGGF